MKTPLPYLKIRCWKSPTLLGKVLLFVLRENVACESIPCDHRIPFTQRLMDNRFFVLPFKLLAQATTTVFLRLLQRRDSF
ncbi:MAG: 7TM-DISM domain-containing protein [bacterium]